MPTSTCSSSAGSRRPADRKLCGIPQTWLTRAEIKFLQVTKTHMPGISQRLTRTDKLSPRGLTARFPRQAAAGAQRVGAWQPLSTTRGSLSTGYACTPPPSCPGHGCERRVPPTLRSLRLSARLPASVPAGPARARHRPLGTQGLRQGPPRPCAQRMGAPGTHRHGQLPFRGAQRLVDRAVDDFVRNNLDLARDKANFHLVLVAFQAQAVRLFLTTKIESGCQPLE